GVEGGGEGQGESRGRDNGEGLAGGGGVEHAATTVKINDKTKKRRPRVHAGKYLVSKSFTSQIAVTGFGWT
ncbi:MAG: hypothetical protein AAGL92_01650, partial [Pseudomonadota bacterium]